jgi:hypothetical protein
MDVESMSVDELAEEARNENWEVVDRIIEREKNNPEYLSKARLEWLHSKDGNVVDLGASLYEKTDNVVEFDKTKSELKRVMTFGDSKFARYRAAFALRRHGATSLAVKGVITEALGNDDVREFAEGYLEGDWDEVKRKGDWEATDRGLGLEKVREVWDLAEKKRK